MKFTVRYIDTVITTYFSSNRLLKLILLVGGAAVSGSSDFMLL